jgi:hypothetical protein
MAYDMAADEFDLDDADKEKSARVLFPVCQLIINKKGGTSI